MSAITEPPSTIASTRACRAASRAALPGRHRRRRPSGSDAGATTPPTGVPDGRGGTRDAGETGRLDRARHWSIPEATGPVVGGLEPGVRENESPWERGPDDDRVVGGDDRRGCRPDAGGGGERLPAPLVGQDGSRRGSRRHIVARSPRSAVCGPDGRDGASARSRSAVRPGRRRGGGARPALVTVVPDGPPAPVDTAGAAVVTGPSAARGQRRAVTSGRRHRRGGTPPIAISAGRPDRTLTVVVASSTAPASPAGPRRPPSRRTRPEILDVIYRRRRRMGLPIVCGQGCPTGRRRCPSRLSGPPLGMPSPPTGPGPRWPPWVPEQRRPAHSPIRRGRSAQGSAAHRSHGRRSGDASMTSRTLSGASRPPRFTTPASVGGGTARRRHGDPWRSASGSARGP